MVILTLIYYLVYNRQNKTQRPELLGGRISLDVLLLCVNLLFALPTHMNTVKFVTLGIWLFKSKKLTKLNNILTTIFLF